MRGASGARQVKRCEERNLKRHCSILWKGVFLLFVLSAFASVAGGEASETEETGEGSVFEMSLDDLLKSKIAVPAALTKLTRAETPASITVITAEDIRYSPARNIHDLIEIYVPGGIWMNHEEGPLLGVRGNIVNRNYKYLLLVNGRLMNSKAQYGAKSELEQWDMSDIQQIEIVRGPGSVTYGPGAVAGVINIITHNAKSAEGSKFSARYVNQYDSKGVTLSHGHQGEKFDIYTFASVTRTNGDDARQYLVTKNNEVGYIGKDILLNTEPLDYFADYQDDPQVKLYMDMEFLNNWRFWLRYTQEGSTWRGNESKSNFNGKLLNQQSLRDRQWTATLEYQDELRDGLALTTMLSMDSLDAERRKEDVEHPDPDHAQNFKTNYSETEILLRGILNWQTSDWTEVAFGAEYSRDEFGPGWGDDEKDMRLGEDGIIVSGADSNVIGPALSVQRAIFAGDGWYTNTYSLFGESNLTLSPRYKVLISGRFDKNTFTDWLFSPRVALISKLSDRHIVKLIAQRSQRMNTAGQLYVEDQKRIDSKEESLNSIELAYTGQLSDPFTLKLAGFYNDAEVIAWNGNVDASIPVGDLQLYGIEAEISYDWSSGSVGANYSFVKQDSWNLADNLISSSISYSEYKQPLLNTNAVMLGVGNDLNNWPNQALKFFGRKKLFSKMMLHVNAHLFWDYKGAKDGLESLRRAVQGEPEQAAVEQTIRAVEDKDVYEYDFRLNASLTYTLRDNLDVHVFAQNLIGTNNNKRYSFDSGNKRATPRRVRFVEEPRTLGIRMDYKF